MQTSPVSPVDTSLPSSSIIFNSWINGVGNPAVSGLS